MAKFRYRIDAGSWVDVTASLPYAVPGTTAGNSVDVRGISATVSLAAFDPDIEVIEDDLGLVVDATFSVSATDLVVDITAPPAYVGTYLVPLADIANGPVNIIAPVVTGTIGTGNVATATAGVWVYDVAHGTPTITRQWERADGSDIAGETGTTITQVDLDRALGLNIAETAINTEGSTTEVAVFRAPDPVVSVRFPTDVRVGPRSPVATALSRKFTYAARFFWEGALSGNSQLFGTQFTSGISGGGTTIGVQQRRNGSVTTGLTFSNTNYTHGSAAVSVMVAADFDASLSGSKTYTLWVNGAEVSSMTVTDPAWLWDLPLNGSGGVIGNGINGGFPKPVVLHYGAVWACRDAVLDPVTHWTSFFNPDGTMKNLGDTGVIGGVTPSHYFPLTSLLTGLNKGMDGNFPVTGAPEASF
jgi:hypothetical protein